MVFNLSFLEGVGFASILWVLVVALVFVFRKRKEKSSKEIESEVEDGLPYLDEMIKG